MKKQVTLPIIIGAVLLLGGLVVVLAGNSLSQGEPSRPSDELIKKMDDYRAQSGANREADGGAGMPDNAETRARGQAGGQ